MKKLTALLMATLMTVTLTGCGSETPSTGDGESVKIGLVLGTGGLGDKNMNDMAYEGISRAKEELGIEFDYVEPGTVSDFLSYQRQFAETEEYDLIIGVGSDQEEAIKEISAEFPEQKISLLDCTSEIEGVQTVMTEWTEQTFLAGVIAGLGTISDMDKANADNKIGVILGMDLPNLKEGLLGFKAGAKYVNPDVEVLEGVVGAFNDPGKGKEIAISMYKKGADFVQTIAGASGLGVFGAAKEEDKYVFGVGANQNGEDPEHVVATSSRNVADMVYSAVQSVVDGTWEAGLKASGMKENAVGCDLEGSNVTLPEDIKTAVEEIREKIVSGELELCKSEADLDAWVAQNQYKK